ncbi:hypothetical protein RIF29_03368 [Crotalaria pallida]|uniref:WW domain-containing protein n=1 Tax=Crotalaria pallida TaxID=3830 RepID=A0AAN9P8M4_CROPI
MVQSPMLHEEAKGSLDEVSEDLDINVSVDLVAQNDEQQNTIENSTSFDVEGGGKNESDVADGTLQNEMVSKIQMSVSETLDERVVTDMSSGWKMVMHEESQCYYYWNIETGETSWEVPQVLAQAAELANDLTPPTVDDKTTSAAFEIGNSDVTSAGMQGTLAASTIDGSLETTVTSHKELLGHGSLTNGINDHSSDSKFSVEEQQSEIDFPSCLVKQSESLLERLKSLENSNSKGNFQGQDSLSRYIMEIEIRLADFKSLASYGSSLLPFWLHSDRQIKLLESVVNYNLSRAAESAHNEVEDKHVHASEGLDEQQNVVEHESEVDHDEKKGGFITSDVCNGSDVDAYAAVLREIYNKVPTNGQHVPLSNATGSHRETGFEVNSQVEAMLNPKESTHEHGCNVGDDVDMDVDMEVEDMNSSGNSTVADISVVTDYVQTDQPVQSNSLADYPSSLPGDEFVVPPPPDDEWIPPPPPDSELMPPPPPPDDEQVPPPPGDPVAHPYYTLPSYTEAGQSLSYAQYSLPYPGPSSEYYGQTSSEVPNSNVYGQFAIPPVQPYYSAIPNTYSDNSQVIINPTNPVAYYELQEVAGSSSIPVVNINDSADASGDDRVSSDVPSTSSSIHAPATVSVDDCGSLLCATGETATGSAASSVVTKAQTKVVRSRKRVAVGSSLKSNKKVSSLVDKWKAAKEELLDEEEEPESVYEALERKRQREIEEWRAKQIASGEAKDNANFQPLGGDWRERVKRKRAQAASKSIDIHQDAAVHKQQVPDVMELSKGLPSCWQVYWDETSKQVYYGNTTTLETTWTRPTK